MSYGLKNSGIVFISVMSQSLTCSIVTGESLFDAVLRNDICLSTLKAVLNLEEEVWWCLAWFWRTAVNQQSVFMQDNAPCHTVKSLKTFLSEEDVTVMEWPAQSPDMNPIENVWKLLNERAKEKNPRNVEELWTNLKGEWEKISVDKCKTLIRLCSKRCQAIIESKGLQIKY